MQKSTTFTASATLRRTIQKPATIEISHLTKHFKRTDGQIVPAIDDVTIRVEPGELLVLLGPSGCGKTTLLRAIAGLETPTGGTIRLGDETLFSPPDRNVPANERGIAMVFQGYALWPHMTVRQNVEFPLTTKGSRVRPRREERRRIVQHALEVTGIYELLNQPVTQLSGGQQQRVALARAVASGASVMLFDEPLSNVDAKIREQLREEIRNLQKRLGVTAVYVTHDQVEAMGIADRIAVLGDGRVSQVGTPQEIYVTPASRYVADFVGATNTFSGTVKRVNAIRAIVETPLGQLEVLSDENPRSEVTRTVLTRVERWALHRNLQDAPAINRFLGTIRDIRFLGSYYHFIVDVGPTRLDIHGLTRGLAPGDQVFVSIHPEHCRLLREDK